MSMAVLVNALRIWLGRQARGALQQQGGRASRMGRRCRGSEEVRPAVRFGIGSEEGVVAAVRSRDVGLVSNARDRQPGACRVEQDRCAAGRRKSLKQRRIHAEWRRLPVCRRSGTDRTQRIRMTETGAALSVILVGGTSAPIDVLDQARVSTGEFVDYDIEERPWPGVLKAEELQRIAADIGLAEPS